ncbi:gamma-glutamylcyclotransferase [Paenibacillus sp.]|uniref:gamma-glutamylcyclotransferase n=1 Tax=Paenibacillus sp. TaxID=58172 RepID=UPI002D421407|nr:gamma-glutamylcyclotransferase [Paenibacillus sp.]HZG56089.1 gamma-glutamylcyclotransferase [Paenibacillus sp.]
MLTRVFVYGSLMKGQGNHRIVKRYVRSVSPATMRGWMFNTGYYPAVATGGGTVRGQVLELDPPERAYAAMDILEGFEGPGHPKNLYERIETTVRLASGEDVECCAYVAPDRTKAALAREAALMPDGAWGEAPSSRLYFAYGSCMSEASFGETARRYERIGPALLPGYRVAFTKHSGKWNGAVADIVPTTAEDAMEGVLYVLPDDQLEALDAREGANLTPPVYRRKEVSVVVDGLTLPAFTYEVVEKLAEERAPSDAYAQTILEGAKSLSAGYVGRLVERMRALQSKK